MTAVPLDNLVSYILNCLFGTIINPMEDTHVEWASFSIKWLNACLWKKAIPIEGYIRWKFITRSFKKDRS